MCKELAKLPKKNLKRKRVVIITCGPDPAYAAEYDFVKEEISFDGSFIPDIVDEDKIVDTNGAGDAFAGGFLSQFVQNKELTQCIRTGHWAASQIIQERGCIIPYEKTYI